jgi:hypothetical protein
MTLVGTNGGEKPIADLGDLEAMQLIRRKALS